MTKSYGIGEQPPSERGYCRAAGGPLKPDLTFSFFNYEGLQQALASPSIATVPSAARRAPEISGQYIFAGDLQIRRILAARSLPGYGFVNFEVMSCFVKGV